MTLANGWTLMATPDFQGLLDRLMAELETLKVADPEGFASHAKAKVTARILNIILREIPTAPDGNQYRQGKTLGGAYKHWRRAKFLQRYRLFFRYDGKAKVVIYAWLNDETTLRKAGSKNDPYAVFAGRLTAGDPPTSWDDLVEFAKPLRAEPPGPPNEAPKRKR